MKLASYKCQISSNIIQYRVAKFQATILQVAIAIHRQKLDASN